MAADKFVDANGLRLHYLDYGNDGAPWVVCVHGLEPAMRITSTRSRAHLAAKYHVISVDVRGRGDSQWGPPTEYLPQNYVTDLARMLEGLGIARVEPDRHVDGRDNLDDVCGRMAGARRAAGDQRYRAARSIRRAWCESRITSATAPEHFKDIGEVDEVLPGKLSVDAAKLADEVVAEQVKWSVKPGTDGGLVWKMDPNVGGRCAAARRSSGSICGCHTRESRARF